MALIQKFVHEKMIYSLTTLLGVPIQLNGNLYSANYMAATQVI